MADEEARPEKRQHRRFSLRVPIYLAMGDEVVRKTVHLESRDVSAGGLSFETGRDVPLDSDAQVILARAGAGESALAIRGRVVWTRRVPETGRYIVGVRFTDFDGLTREELAARVEALASG
jgi:c-di-GMP-binding flagellar brake protein YcgR